MPHWSGKCCFAVLFRLLYVGGREDVFPRIFGLVNIRFNTPLVATISSVRITCIIHNNMLEHHRQGSISIIKIYQQKAVCCWWRCCRCVLFQIFPIIVYCSFDLLFMLNNIMLIYWLFEFLVVAGLIYQRYKLPHINRPLQVNTSSEQFGEKMRLLVCVWICAATKMRYTLCWLIYRI